MGYKIAAVIDKDYVRKLQQLHSLKNVCSHLESPPEPQILINPAYVFSSVLFFVTLNKQHVRKQSKGKNILS